MPNSRTGEDYLDKGKKKKKKNQMPSHVGLLDKLRKRKEKTNKAIKSL
tara:strand:+ start:67 stop:210 length:144 start_codon:yes stop_codon:yes gene_type:complete